MTETADCVVVGAGPGGLRAAEVLRNGGRDVIVLERHETVGPKTCAGGLTPRAVRAITALGDPGPRPARSEVTFVSFRGEPLSPLDQDIAVVRTIARRDLGQWQLKRAIGAGVEVRTGVIASEFEFGAHRLRAGDRTIRYRHLIGADGSTSVVRRSLGIPSPRAFFAGEYNVPGQTGHPLHVATDSAHLANGYWWFFPHATYSSLGACAPKHLVAPAQVRAEIARHADSCNISLAGVPFEGAALEVAYYGCHFANDVHLVGDAAGLPSPLTGEGIYPALVSGEAVATAILEPGVRSAALRAWLRIKSLHSALSTITTSVWAREAIFSACSALSQSNAGRRWLAAFFMGGSSPNGRTLARA